MGLADLLGAVRRRWYIVVVGLLGLGVAALVHPDQQVAGLGAGRKRRPTWKAADRVQPLDAGRGVADDEAFGAGRRVRD